MSFWPDTLTVGIVLELLALLAAGYLLLGKPTRENTAMALLEQIQKDMVSAMKAKDEARLGTVR